MPISLTCTCGAKLEIDDAFAGKTIPCPDCQKPLSTAPPPAADQCTSMLAILALVTALTLGLVPLGGLAAAALGYFALKQIEASGDALAGRKIARAGMILGLGATVLTVLLIFFGPMLRIDGFVRAIEYTGNLDYSKSEFEKPINESGSLRLKRPSDGWGRVPLKDFNAVRPDHILLYSPFDDAFLTVLSDNVGRDADKLAAALKQVEESDMVRILMGAIPGRPNITVAKPPSFIDAPQDKDGFIEANGWSQYAFHANLNGRTLAFIVRYKTIGDDTLYVLAAAVRDRNLGRLQPQIEAAMNSFQRHN